MALRAAAASAPHAVIVFLGDNVYPSGMPDSAAPTRAAAERRLMQALRVVRASGARGFLVPGNHDWDSMQPGGWDAVLRQERFIAAAGGGPALLPAGGCPGPAVVDVGAVVRSATSTASRRSTAPGSRAAPADSCASSSCATAAPGWA